MMDLDDTLRHPLTAVSSAIAMVGHLFGFLDPLFGLAGSVLAIVGATAGTWFPLLGVLSSLGEGLAFIPAAAMNNLFLVGAVVYAAYLSESLWEKIEKKLKRS